MQCAMCGREITNPDANYCDYCGTAIGTMTYREEVKEPQKVSEPKEERVSTWLLFGVMCLPMIPLVGGIAYLVILFYWAFAASVEDSRKSFARATLLLYRSNLGTGNDFAGIVLCIDYEHDVRSIVIGGKYEVTSLWRFAPGFGIEREFRGRKEKTTKK